MISFFKLKFHSLISDKKFSEILTGSAWALGAQVVATVLTMVTTIIVARVYGAKVVGVVAIINAFLSMATIFTVLGTNVSILRFIPEHLAKYSVSSAFKLYRKTQYFVAVVSVIAGTILFFGSSLIADKIFSKPHLSFFFSLAAIFIIFKSLMDLNTQAVRGLRLIRVFSFMQLLPALSNLLFLLIATFLFFYQDIPVYALLASFMITALIGALIMDREFKIKMGRSDVIHVMPLKKIMAVSFPMLLTSTMTFIIGQTGVITLGMFRTEAEVGYGAIAVKLATLVVFVLRAVNSMAAPKFSEFFNSGRIDDLFYVAQKSAKLIFWFTTPILLCLVLFGKLLLSILFGKEFVFAYPAMLLVVIGQFVNSISGSTGYFLNMTGNEGTLRNIMFMTAALNLVLNLLLVPKFGINGSAFSVMISTMLWNISALAFIKKKYGKTVGYFPFLSIRKTSFQNT